ncbi:hypothetical protein ACKKBF_B32310 [Auxenochlorella protothecoides x Auxenochlorella symbiontica]
MIGAASRCMAPLWLSPKPPSQPLNHRLPPPRLQCKAMQASTTISPSSEKDMAMIKGFQRWVQRCNNGTAMLPDMTAFHIQGHDQPLGYIFHSFAEELRRFPDVFQSPTPASLTLNPALSSPEERSRAVDDVLKTLQARGLVDGWRGELYPVAPSFHAPPLLSLERAAAVHFGIKAYGVHLNGYVRLPGSGSLELWVATRSRLKPTWPGRLDHMVAGGQPQGLSCAANIAKECWEEAGVPAELARTAVPVGAVSYAARQAAGVKRDVLFCYDLELPLDFVPQPQDDEVEGFERWPLERVAEEVAGGERFKDNCNLVIIDFLLRHGYLGPDTPGYLELLTGLRSGDCS